MATVLEIFNGIPMEQLAILIMNDAMPISIGL
jgi:hypothetical protein